MKPYEIKTLLSELEENFNKQYSKQQVMLINQHLSWVNEFEVKKIVRHFINSKRSLPLPAEFSEALRGSKKFKNEKVSQHMHEPICVQCEGSGVVWMGAQDESEGTIAIFCDCAKGKTEYEHQTWKLPLLSKADTTGLKIKPYGNEWIPKNKDLKGGEFQSLVSKWKKQIKESQHFWRMKGIRP